MTGLTLGTFLKACLICIFLFVDFTFFLALSVGISNIGVYFGIFIFTGLILGTAFSKKLLGLFLSQNSAVRFAAYAVSVLLALCIILCIVFSIAMLYYANKKPKEPNSVAVVLGCKVNGTTPSLMLKARIDAAYVYLIDNPEAVCIACGGKGSDEDISEAMAIKNALVDSGIDDGRIYLDEESADTRQNLENAYKIAEDNDLGYDIAVVTDGFHQMRSQLIAKDCGFETSAVSAKTQVYLLPTYWIREWFALCEYFVFE